MNSIRYNINFAFTPFGCVYIILNFFFIAGTVRGITANSRKKIDILGKIDDEFSKFVPRVDRSMYT